MKQTQIEAKSKEIKKIHKQAYKSYCEKFSTVVS